MRYVTVLEVKIATLKTVVSYFSAKLEHKSRHVDSDIINTRSRQRENEFQIRKIAKTKQTSSQQSATALLTSKVIAPKR